MARIYANCHRCACSMHGGHATNRREADRIAGYRTFTCDDCKEILRQEASAKAAAFNAARDLPALHGTQAQIDWAETIRAKIIGELERALRNLRVYDYQDLEAELTRLFMLPFNLEQGWDRMLVALEILEAKTEAHWWIEMRAASVFAVVRTIVMTVPTREAVIAEDLERTFEETARESSTLVPPGDLASSLVTTITVSGQTILVNLPEKHDAFRAVVKGLGYTWEPGRSCWFRTITEMSGPLNDRVAELAHQLLLAGFKVYLQDGALRDLATSASYTPERTRWIMKRANGKYVGWFALTWARTEDFYERAKRLPGSRYEKPYVLVPEQAFEAVQDFALLYDFNLSAGARSIIEEAAAKFQAKRLEKLASRLDPKAKVDGLKALLTAPVEVPDDLRD